MGEWAFPLTGMLWQSAIVVVPLVVLVAFLCRVLPCRPSTRHSLWLTVLLFALVSPFLPPPSSLGSFRTNSSAGDRKSRAISETDKTLRADSGIAPDEGLTVLDRPGEWESFRAIEHGEPQVAATSPDVLYAMNTSNAEIAPQPRIFVECESEDESNYDNQRENTARSAPGKLNPLAQAAGSGGPSSLTTIPLHAVREKRHDDRRLSDEPWQSLKPVVRLDWGRQVCELVQRSPKPLQIPVIDNIASPEMHTEDSKVATNRKPLSRPTPERGIAGASYGTIGKYEPIYGHPTPIPSIDAACSLEDSPSTLASLAQWAIDSYRVGISSLSQWLVGMQGVVESIAKLPSFPTGLWIIGIALILAGKAWSVIRFRKHLANTVPASEETHHMVQTIAAKLQLRNVPKVFMVSACFSPMVWCGRKSKLLLPMTLWSKLDNRGRQAVICHELAHLRRGDHLVVWLDHLVGCLYWWHPAMWWARNQLHDTAETCCDTWVTWILPNERRAYATALITTKEYAGSQLQSVPVAGIGMTTGRAERFARRLKMVMTQSKRPQATMFGILLGSLVALSGWVATPALSAPPKAESAQIGATAVPVAAIAKTADVVAVGNTGKHHAHAHSSGANHAHTYAVTASDKKANKLEKRLSRLEEKLDKLADKLSRTGDGGFWNRAAPKAPRTLRTPRAPRSQGRVMIPSPELRIDMAHGKKLSRSYSLSAGKLEALTELMVRPDVPILVRPGDDSIGVQGTPLEHVAFQGFVHLLEPSDKKIERTYRLPKGKREAIIELMSRSDVPLLIKPAKVGITVQGNSLQQAAFASFVKMINPHGVRTTRSTTTSTSTVGTTVRGHGACGSCGTCAKSCAEVKSDCCKSKKAKKQSRKAKKQRKARAAEREQRTKRQLRKAERRQHARGREIERLVEAAKESAMSKTQVLQEYTQALEMAKEAREKATGRARQKYEQQLQNVFQEQQSLHENARRMEEQAHELEDQSSELEDKALELQEKATQLEEKEAELRDRAELLKEKAQMRASSKQHELNAKIEELETESKSLRSEMDSILNEAENLTNQAQAAVAEAGAMNSAAAAIQDAALAIESERQASASLLGDDD